MLRDADEERRIGGEEQERLATEVADVILADREFRASLPGIRRRRAQMLVPEGTDRHVGRGRAGAGACGGPVGRGLPHNPEAAR